jgi:hypothetical protein
MPSRPPSWSASRRWRSRIRRQGFEAPAKELIAITRAEPTTADPDREIVDGWAEKLGLSRWYVWKTP